MSIDYFTTLCEPEEERYWETTFYWSMSEPFSLPSFCLRNDPTEWPNVKYPDTICVLKRSFLGGVNSLWKCSSVVFSLFTFTFTYLADAFIQSDLQCIQVIHVLSVHLFSGNRTHNLCAANAMLYHWNTGTLFTVHLVTHQHLGIVLCFVISQKGQGGSFPQYKVNGERWIGVWAWLERVPPLLLK